jgi:hypothetical protein
MGRLTLIRPSQDQRIAEGPGTLPHINAGLRPIRAAHATHRAAWAVPATPVTDVTPVTHEA